MTMTPITPTAQVPEGLANGTDEQQPLDPEVAGCGGAGDVLPQVRVRRRGRALLPAQEAGVRGSLTPEQRLYVLDAWMKSGLPVMPRIQSESLRPFL